MKAYLINMHLLVPRSRSSAKVSVKFKGYISQKMAVSQTHLVKNVYCLSLKDFSNFKSNTNSDSLNNLT